MLKRIKAHFLGDVAEGLGSGLQIRVRRFKSGHHLHF